MSTTTHVRPGVPCNGGAMKSPLLLALTTCAALPLLAGCADTSHASEADDLRERLAALPDVASATLDYTAPVTLDSGKLDLAVAMAGTDPEAVLAVVTTTYDAFAGTHHGEEGDLEVTWGTDALHLRSFEPDAKPADVRAAVEDALRVLDHESGRADVTTQDVEAAPHVRTRLTVTTRGTGAEDLVAALPGLDRRYGSLTNADWTVEAGGWSLTSSGGLPQQDQLALFDRLRAGLPAGATIALGDDAWASLLLPVGTTPEAASRVVDRQLALLGGAGRASYDVQVGDGFAASIVDGECTFDTGALGARLRQEHGAACRKVADPAE